MPPSPLPPRPDPSRSLRSHPNLLQLKRQAKELLDAYRAGDSDAVAEVKRDFTGADPQTFALHDAQLVLARAHGFESWPKLKHHVDHATVARLAEAVKAGDVNQVRSLLRDRPELVHMDMAGDNEHRVLHYAVLAQNVEMVRLLMQAGADARKGIYPHRDATSACTMARERGYDEIVAAIEDEETHRRAAMSCPNATVSPAQDQLNEAIRRGDNAAAVQLLEADPSLIKACDRDGATPLHVAAAMLNEPLVRYLLDHHANVQKTDLKNLTPLDRAILGGDAQTLTKVNAVAELLLDRGAPMTARAAVARGDANAVRQFKRDEAASLRADVNWHPGGIDWVRGGLLTLAVRYDRKDMVELLLDLGLDISERVRLKELEEETHSWGMPLWHAAGTRKYEIAELLLKRGADPNGKVYASGTPVSQTYGADDIQMRQLLERFGGKADAVTIGLFRDQATARRMLAGQITPDQISDHWAGQTAAEQMLWGAACGGSPEIVQMCLPQIDWPRDDLRWFTMLEQPLRMWNYRDYRPDGRAAPADRSAFPQCLRILLTRADPNIPGRFGRTLLHTLAGFGRMTEQERLTFASMLLQHGARVDVRDELLRSTPLGWACRWGHLALVRLLLDRGAPAQEPDAEPWAKPMAWAKKSGNAVIAEVLRHDGAAAPT